MGKQSFSIRSAILRIHSGAPFLYDRKFYFLSYKKSCHTSGEDMTAHFLLSIESIIPYALSTLPDLRQLVQTCIFLEAPFTRHLTLFTFEFQIRLDLLWEWLTLLPK